MNEERHEAESESPGGEFFSVRENRWKKRRISYIWEYYNKKECREKYTGNKISMTKATFM